MSTTSHFAMTFFILFHFMLFTICLFYVLLACLGFGAPWQYPLSSIAFASFSTIAPLLYLIFKHNNTFYLHKNFFISDSCSLVLMYRRRLQPWFLRKVSLQIPYLHPLFRLQCLGNCSFELLHHIGRFFRMNLSHQPKTLIFNPFSHFRNESEAIKTIVENVKRLLDKTELFVADNPVGVEPRVQEMIELLGQKQSNDVLLLGMWGMGGNCKTTIAKAIYNKIGRNFEGKSFLARITEIWEQDAGQVYLQEQLLFDIEKETNTKIHNVESGKVMLKERLRHKKVLLILDDVNKLHQLNVLCGSREWFGSGSRIIITTRDMHILRGRRVDKVFRMKGMDEDESIELFSWHAFKQASPREDFIELSRNVVAYSAGLPLALEVLGSYLFDMEVIEWKNVLEKLKKIPNDEVQEKLKISYDENGIRVLVERSLVTVDYKNKLGMHDLLRDMGREIIRSETPMELEECSRLWFHEDALDVLSKETGTKAIEGLALKLPRNNTKCLSTKAFKEMKKLRLLQLAGVQLVGDFKYLSKDLRWLSWHGFPLACIPTNLYQGSLVSIELENNNVNLLWKEAQILI
ncbi:TMV resistance protein N [Glycine soja]|uniref:TMV resistance protein N n=1 Tax=Glycine soja TaxID=3848 RepID=A0A445L7D6_GLYSO|nr:TMV resistance protein N [Glycine soja]